MWTSIEFLFFMFYMYVLTFLLSLILKTLFMSFYLQVNVFNIFG